jgi:small subunit ribosomal protein S9
MTKVQFYATGKRKEASARVILFPGSGKVMINGKEMSQYFPREAWRALVNQPFQVTEMTGKFNVHARIRGGGCSGQAGALRHGITRALVKTDENLRPVLKKAGLLTRDPRTVERKKYGQRGARARFQFSKR